MPNTIVDPSTLPDVVCVHCGCNTFLPALIFGKLSMLISPTAKEEIVPKGQILLCAQCKEPYGSEVVLPSENECDGDCSCDKDTSKKSDDKPDEPKKDNLISLV